MTPLTSPLLPGAAGLDDDAQRRQRRKDAGISAILHEAAPVRHWDHDLGPDQPRLLPAMATSGTVGAAMTAEGH